MKHRILSTCLVASCLLPTYAQVAVNTSLVGRWGGGGASHVVEVVGDVAFVGRGENLITVDVSDPADPAVLGQVSIFGIIRGIVIEDRYAYVAAEKGGLLVLDVNDLSKPRVVGSLDSRGWALGVAVSGTRAYVAHGGNYGLAEWGLQVIDISDPEHPIELGFEETDGWAYAVDVADHYAYLASGIRFQVFDVEDPTHPYSVSRTPTGNVPYDVVVRNGYAYVVDDVTGLHIFDVSSPAHPSTVGRSEELSVGEGEVALRDTIAYLAGPGGLVVADISDPTQPSLLGRFADVWGDDIAVSGEFAYVVTSFPDSAGMRILDVRDPTNLIVTGTLLESVEWVGEVAGSGSFVYLHTFGDTRWYTSILDASDPMNPIEVGSVEGRVVMIGERYYTVGFEWADDGYFPSAAVLSEADVPSGGQPFETGGDDWLKVNGGYVIHNSAGYPGCRLSVFDVSDPENPTSVGFYEEHCLGHFDIAEGLLYGVGGPGLVILDVTDPSGPLVTAGSLNVAGSGIVAVRDGYAYVGTSSPAGLEVVDVTDPANATSIGFVEFGHGGLHDIAVRGNYAYVASDYDGLEVVDITDPSHPFLAASYETVGRAGALAVNGDLVYLAGDEDGLFIIRHEGLATASEGDESEEIPERFDLHQNYPNPFNPTTTIQYDVPKATVVRLTVYDALGRIVESLVNSHQSLGRHSVSSDASGLPSGVYFYRLEAGEFVQTRSMIVAK